MGYLVTFKAILEAYLGSNYLLTGLQIFLKLRESNSLTVNSYIKRNICQWFQMKLLINFMPSEIF